MEKHNDRRRVSRRRRKRRRVFIILAVILFLLLVVGAALVIWAQSQSQRDFERYQFDTSAMEGRIQTMTEAEIQQELNRVVEEGMFNISIASSVVFENPEASGQARIENVAANRYHMQVDITLDDTGETVYSSQLIRPGYSIEHIKLKRPLPPGEYAATAVFSAITQQEMQLFGQAAAQIKLYVLDETGHIPTPTPTSQPGS